MATLKEMPPESGKAGRSRRVKVIFPKSCKSVSRPHNRPDYLLVFVRDRKRKRGSGSTGGNRDSLNSTPSSKLFIGGLSYRTDDQSLKDAFARFGEVTEASVITYRDTGLSRVFGFVNFTSDESASEALSAMDGQELDGRNIHVNTANERRRNGFGGGSGGGYRGRFDDAGANDGF